MGYEFKRPDATAMERVLARHPADPEGAVLRLAWQAGLSREEIAGLTWPQVDLTDSVLYLSDRTVPLEGDTLNCLRRRHERYAAVSDHVVISDRYKRPMPPESVSRLARNALDAEDLRVSLKDLRQDFVIRQLETHDWPYAARVSGMAVSTLRGAFSQYFRPKEEKRPEPPGNIQEREYLLWRILQQEGGSLVGMALWMSWKLNMQPGEILELTWPQVDFDRDVITLPDREIPMGSRLSRQLRDAWDHRRDPAQPRIMLAPATGRPMDLARLSTITRTALIHGGLEDISLGDLCRWSRRDDRRRALLAALKETGSLTREEVMTRLGITKNAALTLLNALRRGRGAPRRQPLLPRRCGHAPGRPARRRAGFPPGKRPCRPQGHRRPLGPSPGADRRAAASNGGGGPPRPHRQALRPPHRFPRLTLPTNAILTNNKKHGNCIISVFFYI